MKFDVDIFKANTEEYTRINNKISKDIKKDIRCKTKMITKSMAENRNLKVTRSVLSLSVNCDTSEK